MNQLEWNSFAKQIAEYIGVDEQRITRETDLYTDLLMDSLSLFSMGAYLQEVYQIEVSLNSAALISKAGELFDLMKEEGVREKRE